MMICKNHLKLNNPVMNRCGKIKMNIIPISTGIAGLILGLLIAGWIAPHIKRTIIQRELIKYVRCEFSEFLPLPYHIFTPSSVRQMIGEALPDLYPFLDDEMMKRVHHEMAKKNALHLEAAQNPPASDTDIVGYMAKTSLLSQLDLSEEAALAGVRTIDARRRAMMPLKSYTEYHSAEAPQGEINLPAEFEPIKAILIAWPVYYPYNWITHTSLVRSIIDANADAHIVLPDEYCQKGVELFLSMNKVPLDRVRFIHTPLDNVWIRDYGPTAVYQSSTGRMLLIANPYLPNGEPFPKSDAEVPVDLGRYYGLPVYRLPLIIEGGNIISDGRGTSIMFDSVLKRNPDVTEKTLKVILKTYYGIDRLVLLESLSGEITGHVDMVVRFIDADTIMVAESDPSYKWHKDFERIASQISTLKSAHGIPYRIIRVPIAENDNESVNFWSYINSLIVNDTVIVPVFGVPQDEKSIVIYRKAMPRHKIATVNMRNYQVGSVHCQSKEIPKGIGTAL